MLLARTHAAQQERELRGYRFLWSGVHTVGTRDTFENLSFHAPFSLLGLRIAGTQGAEVTPGRKAQLEVPCDCYLMATWLFADRPGSIVFDVYRSTLASFPPGPLQTLAPLSIGKPRLDNQRVMQDWALFGWRRALRKGELLVFEVLSVANIANVTLALIVSRNSQP